ncbi:hypothetical protein Q31b_12780 [Novipirellula aureliae]|uniref:Heparinase II/III-like protein n=1 Tax=Novipirellula aureliae TaxID=2527966 RepID=A0A5C6E4B8_9BACT|nr:hypothetical protein [Novipirellula aureliae]TWU43748.1 hypothetical protein Q31b_12780 [Novipirellula aureliae]
MSIDTSSSTQPPPPFDPPSVHAPPPSSLPSAQRNGLRQKLQKRAQRHSAKSVFGKSAIGGNVYRWGVAVALGDEIDSLRIAMSQLACDQKPKRRLSTRPLDYAKQTRAAIEHFATYPFDTVRAADAVVWCAAMPSLSNVLEAGLWWDLLGALLHYHESILQEATAESPLQLLVGAELGLTMAWRLADVPSCKRQRKSSLACLDRWSEHREDSVPALLSDLPSMRLALASLYRCRAILSSTTKKKKTFPKDAMLAGQTIATWVAALTTPDGGCAFQTMKRKDVMDDLNDFGLLSRSADFDPESLKPAISATLKRSPKAGKPPHAGRLAWEVSLPDSYHHCDKAKVAALLPQWNVWRGRIDLQYSGMQNSIDLFAGRVKALSGEMETKIAVDSRPQTPTSGWTYSCEYTDDDVHYLELEQSWTGDIVLQRQFMLLREDRCVMIADSVLSQSEEKSEEKIDYSMRLPIAESVSIDPEAETREIFLAGRKRQAMLVPLAAAEWRIGASTAALEPDERGDLMMTNSGRGALYAPLWLDFQPRRFKRKRTWRQLTVADERRICTSNEAVGFRIQAGSEQWMLYRSLGLRRCRTIMGKNLVADFFAARFDMGDAEYEDLVTVDDREQMDD